MERCPFGGDNQREVEFLEQRYQGIGPGCEIGGWTATQDVEQQQADEGADHPYDETAE